MQYSQSQTTTIQERAITNSQWKTYEQLTKNILYRMIGNDKFHCVQLHK